MPIQTLDLHRVTWQSGNNCTRFEDEIACKASQTTSFLFGRLFFSHKASLSCSGITIMLSNALKNSEN